MIGEEGLSKLIELIYQASGEPKLWSVFLETLAENLRTENTILWAAQSESSEDRIEVHVRMDPACWKHYQQCAERNIWIQRLDKLVPHGQIRYSEAAFTPSELEGTEFYNEFLRRWNWDHGFGVKIPYGAAVPAHLTSIRSKRLGPFEKNDGKLLSLLVPHIRQALSIYAQLAGVKPSVEVMEDLDVGIVLLGAGGAILYSNAYARDVFSKKDGLSTIRCRMVAQSTQDSRRLENVLSKACATTTAPAFGGGEVLVSRPSGKRSYVVRVSPLRNFCVYWPKIPVAVAFIRDLDCRLEPDLAHLRISFNLTAAEANVASLLAAGKDVAQIADFLGVKPNTVRIQLKRAFSKTCTRNQADLVRLVLTSRMPSIQHVASPLTSRVGLYPNG